MELADLSVMNSEEAELIAGAPTSEQAVDWFRRNGPELTVITSGADPTVVIEAGNVMSFPVPVANVVFDIGAGDTFHAGFLAEYTRGMPIERAIAFATGAAALKISRPPEIEKLPTLAEVEAIDGF